LLLSATGDADVAGYVLDRPVLIDEDCWLGAHVVVAPGVRIGRGAVVGANSVVTRDIGPYAIVVGAPAKPINQRLAWRPSPWLDATSPEARPYLYAGFDVVERKGEALAMAAGEVSVALAAPSRRVFEASFIAEAKGALAAFGRSQPFGEGEKTLRWSDCHAPTTFDQTVLVALDFAFEKPGARVRLLRCGFPE
jgi:hypothetical protein